MFASALSLWLTLAAGQTVAPGAAMEASWLKSVPADVDVAVRVRGLEAGKNDLVKMITAMSPTLAEHATPALDAGLAAFTAKLGPDAAKLPFLVVARLPAWGDAASNGMSVNRTRSTTSLSRPSLYVRGSRGVVFRVTI